MSGLSDFLNEGGDQAKEIFLWGMLQTVVEAAIVPYLRDLEYAVNNFDPNVVLEPETLAVAVRRGFITLATAQATAKKSGISEDVFNELVKIDATPLSPDQYVLMARRGIIDKDVARTLAEKAGLPPSTFTHAWDFITEPLSPAVLADLVLRGYITQTQGVTESKKSGIDADNFGLLVHDTGEPPGLESVLQWYRRGLLPWSSSPGTASVEEAIRTSRVILATWATAIRASNIVPMNVAEAVDAVVENQIPRGTPGTFQAAADGATVQGLSRAPTTGYGIAWANGIPPAVFDIMVNTRGNPPAPGQLLDLFRRGAIAWTGTGPTETTVQQGIYEGATKDKWEPLYRNLILEIPSLYYVKLMLQAGSITTTKATELLTAAGYTQTVVTGIVNASHDAAVTTYKKLTESIIVQLYKEKAVSRATAKTMLVDIGYSAASATFVLDTADLQATTTAVNSAITRIQNLYLARKITKTTALTSLGALGIVNDQATSLLTTWTLERSITVKILTESQIVDAWGYGVITQAQAQTELEAIGYTPYDAWVLLSVKNKAPLGTKPGLGPAPTGNIT